jgi:hypothetical protein
MASGDITNPRLLYAKGMLFLTTGVLAALLLVNEHPTFKVVLLLALSVWCFARAYYFAFYVIGHYIDPQFRFAGLFDFARYALRSRNADDRNA